MIIFRGHPHRAHCGGSHASRCSANNNNNHHQYSSFDSTVSCVQFGTAPIYNYIICVCVSVCARPGKIKFSESVCVEAYINIPSSPWMCFLPLHRSQEHEAPEKLIDFNLQCFWALCEPQAAHSRTQIYVHFTSHHLARISATAHVIEMCVYVCRV